MTITLTKKDGTTITFEPSFDALHAAQVIRDDVFLYGQGKVSPFAFDLSCKALDESRRFPLSEKQEGWLIYLAMEICARIDAEREAEMKDFSPIVEGAKLARPRCERFVVDAQVPIFAKLSQDKKTVHLSTGISYGEGRYLGKIDAGYGSFTPSRACTREEVRTIKAASDAWKERPLGQGVERIDALQAAMA